MLKKYDHITISSSGMCGKHTAYVVMTNKKEVYLGTIEYYQQWKKYIFAPAENAIFDLSCLRNIVDFLEDFAGDE